MIRLDLTINVVYLNDMNTVKLETLQTEIEALPDEEYMILRQWFAEKDWERWDQELKSDIEQGKLDFLIDEAFEALAQDNLREL